MACHGLVLVFLFFVVGAAVQILAMRYSEMSTNALIVIAMKAILACGLGYMLFEEAVSICKIAGVVLVVVGVSLLRAA